MKYLRKLGAVAAVAALSAVAVSQNAVRPAKDAAEAKAAIEARQALFEDIKKAHEPIAAMMKRQRELDAAVVATSATKLQELAGRIPAAFLVDTHQYKDIETKARENIWAGQAAFKDRADSFGKAAANTASVAKGGDKAATFKAMVDMSKTCGACHDDYKTS